MVMDRYADAIIACKRRLRSMRLAVLTRPTESGPHKISETLGPLCESLDRFAGGRCFFASNRRARYDLVVNCDYTDLGDSGAFNYAAEVFNFPITGNPPVAISRMWSKETTRRCLAGAGIQVPLGFRINGTADNPAAKALLLMGGLGVSFPVIVKPESGAGSYGVSLARHATGLAEAITGARSYGPELLIESFIVGEEFTIGVFGDEDNAEAMEPAHIRAVGEEFVSRAVKANHETRFITTFPNLSREKRALLKSTAIKCHAAVGAKCITRTDIMLTSDGRAVVLEVNANPVLSPASPITKFALERGGKFEDVLLIWLHLSITRYSKASSESDLKQ